MNEYWKAALLQELRIMQPGWCGKGSVPPSDQAVQDCMTVLSMLAADVPEPTVVEVDEDDGAITLRWVNDTHTAAVALVVSGNGNIVGCRTTTPQTPFAPWRLAIADENRVRSKLNAMLPL